MHRHLDLLLAVVGVCRPRRRSRLAASRCRSGRGLELVGLRPGRRAPLDRVGAKNLEGFVLQKRSSAGGGFRTEGSHSFGFGSTMRSKGLGSLSNKSTAPDRGGDRINGTHTFDRLTP